MKRIKLTGDASDAGSDTPVRERVLSAAFSAFMDHGFEGASTLEIATRARVSKRELYALFDDKHAMLAACIAERAKRMRLPLTLPAPRDRKALTAALIAFGAEVLRVVCHPTVLALYRLAIAESDRSPAIGHLLESNGREANRAALEGLTSARANHLVGAAEPAEMAQRFAALLWDDLLVRLLLRTANSPTPAELEQRARAATAALLALYPPHPRSRSAAS